MNPRSTNFLARRLAGPAIALLLVVSAVHAADTPFAGLAGPWAGNGTITASNGSKERIRCRALYRVDGTGATMQLELRCASDSYKFELQSSVDHKAGALSGSWSELTRGAIGSLEGTAKGNRMQLRANSPVFSAFLAVVTHSNQQSISIQSPGSEIETVSISLSKSAR